mgnify:FL=1
MTASLALANSWHDKAESAAALLDSAMARLRQEAGENRLIMPVVRAEHTPPPLLDEALTMLHQGKHDQLRPHLPALLASLLPLLEFANGELNLGCSLEKLKPPAA